MSREAGETDPSMDVAEAAALARDVAMRWHPNVACRTLEGTAFVLLDSRMVRLNEVGTRIWELFEDGSTLGDVAAQVASEFEVEVERVLTDAEVFVRELSDKGMLVTVEAGL